MTRRPGQWGQLTLDCGTFLGAASLGPAEVYVGRLRTWAASDGIALEGLSVHTELESELPEIVVGDQIGGPKGKAYFARRIRHGPNDVCWHVWLAPAPRHIFHMARTRL